MSRRDLYHNAVKQALIKDGWNITHDPYTVAYGVRHGFVDLGAERLFAAEKEGQKIAVEVKGFMGASTVADMEQALGQYLLYRSWMARMEPDRLLFLAINNEVATEVFEDVSGRVLVEDYHINLLIFHVEREEVVEWRNAITTEP
jgi:hypothetical protein